uniref:Cocaine- and amphetamine-regulated transcript 4 n=2 Tax=Oncorhynchus tshawytscha TaxID=74940 RepID=A0A8C8EIP7_ONCTS
MDVHHGSTLQSSFHLHTSVAGECQESMNFKRKIFSTMDSIRVRAVFYLGVCLSVFSVDCQEQMSPDNILSSQEEQFPLGYVTRNVADVLEGLLEGGQQDNMIGLSVEKKASLIPRCDVGERCAMKHGPRIGRLCDCLRGTACNTFFLRCY